jgi:hypothetical protein
MRTGVVNASSLWRSTRVALAFLLLAFSFGSCTQPPAVTFSQGGALSDVEKRSLLAIHPKLAHWRPTHSAHWDHDGLIRHVCLSTDGGSIVWPYDVFAFDQDGTIVEANFIDAPSGAWPNLLTSVSPLRVGFVGGAVADKAAVVVGLAHSKEAGRQKVVQRAEEKERFSSIFQAWKASGNTNTDTLMEMLRASQTNSHR